MTIVNKRGERRLHFLNGICKVSQFCQSVGFTNKDNKNHKESLSSLREFAFLFFISFYSSLEFSHRQSTVCVCVAPFLPSLVFLNQVVISVWFD